MVVKQMSIFVIKKKEPADYEPPHSAGIAYPSHGQRNGCDHSHGLRSYNTVSYCIVNIFVPFSHLVIMMISSMVIFISLRVEKLNR